MITKMVPLIGAMILWIAPALAQGPAPTSERGGRMAACRADIAMHCSAIEAGGGRRIACLVENKAKLSPECAQVVETRGDKAGGRRERAGAAPGSGASVNEPAGTAAKPDQAPGAVQQGDAQGKGKRGRMAACRTDLATFCGNVEKGKARGQCLRENQAKLSSDCQAAIGEQLARSNALKTACKADRDILCANVARGGGRGMQCLRDNRAKLSAACGEALSAVPERGRGKGKRA